MLIDIEMYPRRFYFTADLADDRYKCVRGKYQHSCKTIRLSTGVSDSENDCNFPAPFNGKKQGLLMRKYKSELITALLIISVTSAVPEHQVGSPPEFCADVGWDGQVHPAPHQGQPSLWPLWWSSISGLQV